MPLINCEVKLILAWSANCVIIYNDAANQGSTFTITETNLYVLVVTLSTQDNAKLLPQLKWGFQRMMSLNKYLSKPELIPQNANLNHLVDPSLQWVNRLFVLAFENDEQRISSKTYYLPNLEIKDYNVMIDGKKFFDQPIKNNKTTYGNFIKIATGQGDDYTTGCLLDSICFKNYLIAVDLSKQQALDADPKAIQQINFTANLERRGNKDFISFMKKQKKLFLEFLQGTVKVL